MDQESPPSSSRRLAELRGPALRERLVITIRGIEALYPTEEMWEARHAQYIQDYFNVPLSQDKVHAREVAVKIDVKKIESSKEGQGDSIFERWRFLSYSGGNLRGSVERRLAGKYIRVLYDQTTTWKAAQNYDDLYVATQPFMTRQGTSTYYKQFRAFSPEYGSISSVGSVLVDPPPEGAIEIDYPGAVKRRKGPDMTAVIAGAATAAAVLLAVVALLVHRRKKRRGNSPPRMARRNSAGNISALTEREFNRSLERDLNRSMNVDTFGTPGTYDTTYESNNGGQGGYGGQEGDQNGGGKKKLFGFGRKKSQGQDVGAMHQDMNQGMSQGMNQGTSQGMNPSMPQDSRALALHQSQNSYAMEQDSRALALHQSQNSYGMHQDARSLALRQSEELALRESRELALRESRELALRESREMELRRQIQDRYAPQRVSNLGPGRRNSYGGGSAYDRDGNYDRGSNYGGSDNYERGSNYGPGGMDRLENDGEQGGNKKKRFGLFGRGNNNSSDYIPSLNSNPEDDRFNRQDEGPNRPGEGWSSRFNNFSRPAWLDRNFDGNGSPRGIEPDSNHDRRGIEPEDPSERQPEDGKRARRKRRVSIDPDLSDREEDEYRTQGIDPDLSETDGDHVHNRSFDVDSFMDDEADDRRRRRPRSSSPKGRVLNTARSKASSSRSIRFARSAGGVLTAELQRSAKSAATSAIQRRSSTGALEQRAGTGEAKRRSTTDSTKAFSRIDVDAFNDSFVGEINVAGLVGYDVDSYVEREEEMVDVIAPSGKLDVVLVTPEPPDVGPPYVREIKEGSPLEGKLKLGDRIIAVDEEDVRDMTAMKVSKLLASKASNTFRRIAVLREKELPADSLRSAMERGVDVDSYNVTPPRDNTTGGKPPAIDPSEVEAAKEAVNIALTDSFSNVLDKMPEERENEAVDIALTDSFSNVLDKIPEGNGDKEVSITKRIAPTDPPMQPVLEAGSENEASSTAAQDLTASLAAEQGQAVRCAAGHLCQAGPQCADLRNSLYQCMNCRGKMHNVSTCGEVYSRVEKVYGFAIPKENLSLHGQTILFEEDESDLMICSSCLEMLILF